MSEPDEIGPNVEDSIYEHLTMAQTRKLRIGYVPEHFSSPLLQAAATPEGREIFELVSQPSGTGQMQTSLAEDKIDVAVALTEALVAGIAKGRTDYKLVGSYVDTPLNWAVITGRNAPYNSISDLRGTTIGISRIGSGSQVMASVMALQHGWKDADGGVDKLDFKINDTFEKLRQSVNDGTTSCFMWEWFTTKPFQDNGEVRFIGNQLTPWPSWTIAASTDVSRAPASQLQAFFSLVAKHTASFGSAESRDGPAVEFIKGHFGYDEKDVRDWLKTCTWVGEKGDAERVGSVSKAVVEQTLATLGTAGVVTAPAAGWDVRSFVNMDACKLVS